MSGLAHCVVFGYKYLDNLPLHPRKSMRMLLHLDFGSDPPTLACQIPELRTKQMFNKFALKRSLKNQLYSKQLIYKKF